MELKSNPFISITFQNIWKKHFIPNKSIKTFQFIEGINLYKSKFLPVYFNVGKNLTKGNNYKIHNYKDYKNKTLVIYDVLPHLKNDSINFSESIKILKSNQYPGFLIDINQFKNIDDYLLKTFSKNTRMKMRKFSSRLDKCFNISTKMFFGNIDKKEYDDIFNHFLILLQKKYTDKQISNNNMQPSEWKFYKEVAYPLIIEKKASLFVVYDDNTPIAITYNYHTNSTLIDAITVFNIDYSKFNLGYVNNLKLLNWCFNNNVSTLDFSKGYFDYKKRMCTLGYDFEYHLIYDNSSLASKIIAHSYYNFFEFKSYLRSKKLNVKFHKLTYFLRNRNQSKQKEKALITSLDKLPESKNLIKIDIRKDESYFFLTEYVNAFLYLITKPYENINIFKIDSMHKTFIISHESVIQQIKF